MSTTTSMLNKGQCISGYPGQGASTSYRRERSPTHLEEGSVRPRESRGHTFQGWSAAWALAAVVLTLSATMHIVGSHSKISKT